MKQEDIMVYRPGFLNGAGYLKPKQARRGLSGSSLIGLGTFGKGMIAPPPGAPPGTGAPVEGAVNAQTGKPYIQDTRCPVGEKMVTVNVPCHGADCCDEPFTPPNDEACDPEGTVSPEEDCEIDPLFKKVPPKAAPAAAKAAAPTAVAAPAATAASAAETAALAAELQKLEAESEEVDEIVTQQPMLAPPSAYTGSPMPVTTGRRTSSAPSDEDKIAQLVAEHETKQAMQRAYAPAPAMAPPSAPVGPPPSAPAAPQATEKKIGGLFSWLKSTLFGTPSYDFDGLGQTDKTRSIILPLIVGLGILYALNRQRG